VFLSHIGYNNLIDVIEVHLQTSYLNVYYMLMSSA